MKDPDGFEIEIVHGIKLLDRIPVKNSFKTNSGDDVRRKGQTVRLQRGPIQCKRKSTIYTGFRGGKGIATLFGFMIGIEIIAAGVCLLVFLISFFMSKYVSLSSILAAISFPLAIFILYDYDVKYESLFVFSIFVPILALITHQKNIESLIRGEENKAKFGKKK